MVAAFQYGFLRDAVVSFDIIFGVDLLVKQNITVWLKIRSRISL
jgi:hypothetical protein